MISNIIVHISDNHITVYNQFTYPLYRISIIYQLNNINVIIIMPKALSKKAILIS